MSTSRSDRPSSRPGGRQEPAPEAAPVTGAGAGVGVSALFARAVAARKETAGADRTEQAGVIVTKCRHCGAPRQLEELVCRFCKEQL